MNFGFLGIILIILLVVGFIINVVLVFVIIFFECDWCIVSLIWVWLFVLFVFFVIGFILYLFLGWMVFKKKMEKNNGDELNVFEDLV